MMLHRNPDGLFLIFSTVASGEEKSIILSRMPTSATIPQTMITTYRKPESNPQRRKLGSALVFSVSEVVFIGAWVDERSVGCPVNVDP